MTQKFIDNLYSEIEMKVHNVTSYSWRNDPDLDLSIYSDYDEFKEVKIREVIHKLAIKKGIMK